MSADVRKSRQHGEQPTTFVCKHIAAVAGPNTVRFVRCWSEDDEDLRDDWCEDFDLYAFQQAGSWKLAQSDAGISRWSFKNLHCRLQQPLGPVSACVIRSLNVCWRKAAVAAPDS